MHIGIHRITVSGGVSNPGFRKDLSSLLGKIRARFPVSVESKVMDDDDQVAIFIAALSHRDTKVRRWFEDISTLCETSGFGRVIEQTTEIEELSAYDEL